MLLFIARSLAMEYGGREIFSGVDLEIDEGEKVALVGANGVGKTTLLRILAGLEKPTLGTVRWYQRIEQGVFLPGANRWESQTVRQILQESLAKIGSGDPASIAKRLKLTALLEHPYQKLSGGEKTRLGLGCALANSPRLLFLDEPTNHLDMEHLNWLEGFIRDYRGTVLLVSHDRTFMDRCVSRVIELEPKGATSYPGNYSSYRQTKREKYESDLKTFYDQEKQAEKLEKAIDEQKRWSQKGYSRSKGKARASGNLMGGKEFYRKKAEKLDRRAKSTIKRLERFKEERVKRPEEAALIQLAFQADPRRGNGLLLGEGISKSYGERSLLKDIRFAVKPGQKIALIGSNGTGKTTLLRMILEREPMDGGDLWRSPSLRVGVLDQELQMIEGEKTALEETLKATSDPRRARDVLASLLLRGDDVYKPCSVLSMGERVRVALAKMLLNAYNLLLLDEPGNYLDLPSREHLEEALRSYHGAVILISHDRSMLQAVCDTVWSIHDQQLHIYPGDLNAYFNSLRPVEKEMGEEEKLRMRLRLAEIGSLLALTDRQRQEAEYLRLETEYLEISSRLRRISGRNG